MAAPRTLKKYRSLVLEPLEPRLLLSVSNPFATPVFTAVAGQPHIVGGTVKPADSFDADGNGFNDVVIWYDNGSTPAPTSTLSIMLGQSGGAYHEQNIETISQSAKIVDAELADFKDSGKPDLAVQWESYTGGTPTDGEIDIFVNNGNGTFTKTATESVAAGSTMHILDVNGDGKQDLFVENPTDDGVTVYLGKGDGTFQTGVTTNFPSGHKIVEFNTDLNADNVVDLVVNYQTGTPMPPSYAVTSTLEVHFGKADGSFDIPADWTDPATDSYFQTVADFSGTQYPDILAYHRTTETPIIFDTTTFTEEPVSTDVVVFKNDGTGHFGSAPTFTKTLAAGYENAALPVDLNNDGNLDLVLTDGIINEGGFGSATRTIYIEKGAGNGTFTEPETIPVNDLFLVEAGQPATDVDHDGFPDLVASIYSTDDTGTATDWGADIFFSNHDCTFQAAVNLKPATAPTSPVVLPLDLANDHLLDMVFWNNPSDSGTGLYTADQLFVFPNTTGKAFGAENDVDFGANTTNAVELFDFNGDGLADAIPNFNVDANDTAAGFTFWQGGDNGNFTQASSPNLFDPTGTDRAQATPNLIDFKVGGKAVDLLYVGTGPTGLYVVLNDTNVSSTAPSKLVFTTEPTDGVAGTALSTVKVKIEDQSGDVVTTDNNIVTLSLGSGTLGGTFSVTAVNGVATFSNLLVTAAGSNTLIAADTGDSLSDFASNSFTVSPAGASQLVFTAQPADGVAGTALAPVSVTIEDQYGNVETQDTTTVALSLNGGSLGGTTSAAASAGVATFNNLLVTKSSSFTLSAADTAHSLTGFTSDSFTVGPAAASQLVFTTEPANGVIGETLAPVVVKIEDSYGNVEAGDTTDVSLALNPASGSLGGTTPVAAVAGVATFSDLTVANAGDCTLTATDAADSLSGFDSNSFTIYSSAALIPLGTITSPDGVVHVSIYDVTTPTDVDPSNVKVAFGKNDSISSITLGGAQPMEGLGLTISGATSVGAISDSRTDPGTVAFIASDSSITSLTLKSGTSGYALDGLSLGGIDFPPEIAGSTTDAVALYCTGVVPSITLGGTAAGDFWIGGADPKTLLSNKTFTVKNGGLAGVLATGGGEGTVSLSGDFTSALDIAGPLASLTIKGGNFDGGLSAGGAVGTISVGSQKVAGATVGGGVTGGVINVSGDDLKTGASLKSFSATGSISGLDMTLSGSLGTLGGAGWLGSSLDAASSGAISLSGDFDSASLMNFTGPLASLTIKGGNFGGSLTAGGAVGMITVGSQKVAGVTVGGGVTGGVINVTGAVPKTGASLKSFSAAGAISDLDANLTGGLGSLTALSWTGGTAQAGSVGSVSLKGDFGAEVTLTGALASVTIKGGDFTGSLTAGGPVGTISISSQKVGGTTVGGNVTSTAELSLNGANPKTGLGLGSLTVAGTVTGMDLTTDCGLGSITMGSFTGGSITASYVESVQVNGDMTDSTFMLNGSDAKGRSLGSSQVKGWFTDSMMATAYNIGSLSAGGAENSDVYAGAQSGTTGLVTSASQFVNDSMEITSFTITGAVKDANGDSLINSDISAPILGSVSLNVNIQWLNGSVPFGSSAETIDKLSIKEATGKIVALKNLTQSVTYEDANILLIL